MDAVRVQRLHRGNKADNQVVVDVLLGQPLADGREDDVDDVLHN